MKILHFTQYNALGLQQYQTADKETVNAVAALQGHKRPFDGYIINPSDIDALENAGYLVRII